MKKFLMWMRSKLTLNRTFYFEGTSQDIIINLDGLKTNQWRNGYFYSYFKAHGYYEICATFSVGTLNIRSISGIKLHLIHTEIDECQQRVQISTKVRPENWFILLIGLFMVTSSIRAEDAWYEFLFAIVIVIILFFWFNFVLKVQEEMLMKKIMKRLRLKE